MDNQHRITVHNKYELAFQGTVNGATAQQLLRLEKERYSPRINGAQSGHPTPTIDRFIMVQPVQLY